MVDNLIQIVYTNSNCKDVFDAFFKQNRKHSKLPLYVISDYDLEGYDIDGFYSYDNSEPYWEVWVKALMKFNSNTFIYLQEDFYLYDDVNEIKIKKYESYILDSNYSFVRLINSGELNNKLVTDNLYEIESTNEQIYSQQPTIWKTNDYIKLLDSTREDKWLETDNYRDKMIKLDISGLYHYDGENKRGKNHFDSNVYPYIATAIVRGKWNLSEYKNELEPILKDNNIDPNIRGLF
tara:strand:- start:1245 stop:1952 length:708 start_codon:yes stop_codon:yes gene_type:complete